MSGAFNGNDLQRNTTSSCAGARRPTVSRERGESRSRCSRTTGSAWGCGFRARLSIARRVRRVCIRPRTSRSPGEVRIVEPHFVRRGARSRVMFLTSIASHNQDPVGRHLLSRSRRLATAIHPSMQSQNPSSCGRRSRAWVQNCQRTRAYSAPHLDEDPTLGAVKPQKRLRVMGFGSLNLGNAPKLPDKVRRQANSISLQARSGMPRCEELPNNHPRKCRFAQIR
jgi:hypothetical protein